MLLWRMVPQAGFEPATHELEIRCSNPLSYWSKIGAPSRIRTDNQGIMSSLLYP